MTTPAPDTHRPDSLAEWISVPARFQLAVVTALLLLVYWSPIRHQIVGRWLSDGNWSHGWLIPLFSLYFLYTRKDQLLACHVRRSYFGAVVLVGALTMYFVSAWQLRMAYPQALSIVGAILGLTLLHSGWQVMRVAWFPIAFLLFAIPLPTRVYVELTLPLRAFASQAAATIMPWFAPGLVTEAQAVIIDYIRVGSHATSGTLNVEEACSGMRLMMAFVAVGVAVTYVHERPNWQRALLLISCVPIAVFCNVIRVTTTGLLYVYGHEDIARGTAHQVLGILTLLIALGLFNLFGVILSNLVVVRCDEPNDPGDPETA